MVRRAARERGEGVVRVGFPEKKERAPWRDLVRTTYRGPAL
jgi:hypothetical protein